MTLTPKSQRALSMTNFLITQGMENLSRSINLGGMLFQMWALHYVVSVTVSLSLILFLLDNISLINLA